MEWAEKYLGSDEDYGFAEMLGATSAILMGSKTFDFQLQAMGGEPQALPSYVLTNNPMRYDGLNDPNVHLIHGPLGLVLDELSQHIEGQVLILGGADVVRQAMDAGKLEQLFLFITPDVLGAGLPLYEGELAGALSGFTLVASTPYSSGLLKNEYRLIG